MAEPPCSIVSPARASPPLLSLQPVAAKSANDDIGACIGNMKFIAAYGDGIALGKPEGEWQIGYSPVYQG